MKKFSIILAIDLDNGIGKNNKIPWNISLDMKYFNNITTMTSEGLPNNYLKNAVIMGRNTWKSLNNKPLKDRLNIVISKNKQNNIETFSNLDDGLKYLSSLNNIENIFVIGGGELYNEAINNINLEYIYLTRINKKYDCDIKVNFDIINDERLIPLYSKKFKLRDKNNEEYVECLFNKYYNILNFEEYRRKVEERKRIKECDSKYLEVLENLIDKGDYRETRNANTYSLFSKVLEFDLNDGFPLLSTKKVLWEQVFNELIWFLKGNTNSRDLSKIGCKVWEKNSSKEFLSSVKLNYEEGDIGPMYGFQLRHFNAPYEGCLNDYTNKGIDQINNCINLLINDPHSRRIIMTTFNPCQVSQGVLYPCHGVMTQFYIENNNKISLATYQRSGDWFLGVVWNIASYSMLLHLIVNTINARLNDNKYSVGRVIIHFGDYHLYEQHLEQSYLQILRGYNKVYEMPTLNIINKKINIEDYTLDDISINNYKYYPGILADMIA